jgi:hypothetical protein
MQIRLIFMLQVIKTNSHKSIAIEKIHGFRTQKGLVIFGQYKAKTVTVHCLKEKARPFVDIGDSKKV